MSKQEQLQQFLPTDISPVIAALQVTLDLDELFTIFLTQMRIYINVDGLHYVNKSLEYDLGLEKASRHTCNYNLQLMRSAIGEITFTRSRRFSEKELGTIEHLLGALIHPLRNCIKYRKALSEVEHDQLTGVLNRAALEKALPREIDLANRTDSALSLLVIDLDHFKRVNDSHGHLMGDSVLQSVTKQIEEVLRGSDLLFRYGGEEFVVLLSHTDVEGAYILAERIRKKIAQTPVQCESAENGKGINITTSIGVADFSGNDNSRLLFDKADKAVYQAKNEGRNRTAVYRK